MREGNEEIANFRRAHRRLRLWQNSDFLEGEMVKRVEALFGVSDVLGFQRHRASLVLDGQLYRLARCVCSDITGDFARLFGLWWRVVRVDDVGALQAQYMGTHGDKFGIVGRGDGVMTDDLAARVDAHNRLCFVVEELIPHLRSLVKGVAMDETRRLGNLCPVLPGGRVPQCVPLDLVEKALRGNVLVLGQNVFEVCPGMFRPHLIRVSGESFGVQVQGRPLMNVDVDFRRRLADVLGSMRYRTRGMQLNRVCEVRAQLADGETLYRDAQRSVILDGQGRIFCCLHVRPFVMEGQDRKLRFFDAVDVKVEVKSLNSVEVFEPSNVHTRGHYEHPFVSAFSSHHVCLGGDAAFYEGFQKMPLKKGMVAFLDAARRVLCAGYFDGMLSAPYDDQALYRRPEISEAEVQRRELPVYRYYRREVA